MKVLIVHHIEPMWEKAFNIPVEDYLEQVCAYIEDSDYDKIIVTSLEGDNYPQLEQVATVCHEWGYGWENPEEYSEWYLGSNIDVRDIIPASGHEFAYLYPWIKALKNDEVTLIGGAFSECLADLRDSLLHLNIKHEIYMPLVYG